MFISYAITGIASNVKYKVVFDTDFIIDTTIAADGNIYSIINFSGCSFTSEEGMPQLPVKIIKLIIPADKEPVDVIWTKDKGKIVSLSYPIIPVQKPIPTEIGFDGNGFLQPNKSVYSGYTGYPVNAATILRTNYIRGNKVVIIEVSPVVYSPMKNELEVVESIELTLILKPSEKKLLSVAVKDKNKYNRYLKSLVDNDMDVEQYSVIKEKVEDNQESDLKSVTTGISVNCEYVVITTSSLSSYFDNFIEWKKQKGVDIELVTTADIFQNYTGDAISGINDNAGKIRQFLSDAYDNGLEYALLGGDFNTVPIRYGCGTDNKWTVWYPNDFKIPSDLYFADFDGDWNVDGDSYLGEKYDDDVDYGAEIYVGRLLCTSGTQIEDWTEKLILYEQNPGNGSTSYLRKAFYTQADQMQDYDQATDIANRFGNIFTTDIIFEEEYNGTPNAYSPESPQFPTGNDVIDEMNNDYGFVSWFNHGAPENIAVATKKYNKCGSNDKKKVTNFDSNATTYCLYPEQDNGLDDLSNSSTPFVLYTLACETMPFDTWKGIAPTSNLGARITNPSGKGAPIYLGNTRYGFVTNSWYMQRSFTSNITGGTYQLGAAEANSKGSSGSHYVWLSHNLLGCPETEMWTSTPSNFTNAYAAICGNNVVVNTDGVTDCIVCVMSSNDNGAAYWQVNSSSVTEKTFYNVTSPFVVTITKHNYIPKIIQSSEIQTTISSSILGPSVICSGGDSFEIEDVPSGSTITWTQSSNITRNSDQGTNPCSFSANSSGSGWIHAQVVTACNDTYNLPNKTVWVGKPQVYTLGNNLVDLNGTPKTYFCYDQANECEAVNIGGDAHITAWEWRVTGGTVYPYGAQNRYATIYPNSYSTFMVEIRAHNACGWTDWARMWTEVEDCYGYNMVFSPNPTTGETTLSIESDSKKKSVDETAEWEFEVYNPNQTIKEKRTNLKGSSTTIQTQSWKEGVYVVRVKFKPDGKTEKILTGKLMVKK